MTPHPPEQSASLFMWSSCLPGSVSTMLLSRVPHFPLPSCPGGHADSSWTKSKATAWGPHLARYPVSRIIIKSAESVQTTYDQFSHSVKSNSLQPRGHSTPGFPVHHQIPEFAQTHVPQVSDAIQSSCPLSSLSPTLSLSQDLLDPMISSLPQDAFLPAAAAAKSFQSCPTLQPHRR